ncbi:MAG: hypothetical protein ACOCWW_03810 [Bacteroidota bacterium]
MPLKSLALQAYRFGFNGMEKDPEITGEQGSHYTAAFWEYDTRIGRRWNVDPVDKPWESSYAAFSNNPIVMVDPKGDDDYFSIDGKFLFSDTRNSNNIRIITKSVYQQLYEARKAQIANGSNVNASTETFYNSLEKESNILSDIEMDKHALRKIGRHYAEEVEGMTGTENIWGHLGRGSTMRVNPYSNGLYLGLFITIGNEYSKREGLTSKEIDDFNNFKSTLAHESWHYNEQYEKIGKCYYKCGPENPNVRELDAYFYQTGHETWSSTTDDYQEGIKENINYFIDKLDNDEDKKLWREKFKSERDIEL